uniref:Uncharacterized protein n=1 Tax=Anguilla anguilla TaxID=7936 RepID=A0A0E9STX6_ANGAN
MTINTLFASHISLCNFQEETHTSFLKPYTSLALFMSQTLHCVDVH